MKKILTILLLSSFGAYASFTPLSGTFSNASSTNSNLSFNLIVTSSEQGQQVSLQCLKGDNASYFHTQSFIMQRTLLSLSNINQALCPFSQADIELDYEEAFLVFNNKKIVLARGNIYVPIKD